MSGKQLDEFGNKIKFIRATFNKIEVNITDIFILINFNWVSIDPFKYLIFFPSSIYLSPLLKDSDEVMTGERHK